VTDERDALEVLQGVLEDRAGSTDAVERVATGDAVEYRVNGQLAVVADRRAVAFRLGERVAAAAARTVDARASGRGPAWVELAPDGIDRFTLDRAEAWFDLALREADVTTAPDDPRPLS
jgi:hypothetical protein